jgi:hypothetical protein
MSSAGRSEDSKEARFGHLLNPIRDLAQNWNIDVARDLEQYLEELEHIEVSFDGGLTSLNFAEAARLIQVRCCLAPLSRAGRCCGSSRVPIDNGLSAAETAPRIAHRMCRIGAVACCRAPRACTAAR